MRCIGHTFLFYLLQIWTLRLILLNTVSLCHLITDFQQQEAMCDTNEHVLWPQLDIILRLQGIRAQNKRHMERKRHRQLRKSQALAFWRTEFQRDFGRWRNNAEPCDFGE